MIVLFLYTFMGFLNLLVPGGGKTRCLLVGCDRFVSMPATTPAGANNTAAMEEMLRDFLPGPLSVRRSVNGPGTAEGLEDLLQRIEGHTPAQMLIKLSCSIIERESTLGTEAGA